MIVFKCGCELQLRHDCETGMFHFGKPEDFDDYTDSNDKEKEPKGFTIWAPKTHADGRVYLKRPE